MNYTDKDIYSLSTSEEYFYLVTAYGKCGLSLNKVLLYNFLLTPTYYQNNTLYFDPRASILCLLISSNIRSYKKAVAQALLLKEEEDLLPHADYCSKNDYSVYELVLLVAKLNNWSISNPQLLAIEKTQYPPTTLIFNTYNALQQLDTYLGCDIAEEVFAIYQRSHVFK